MLLTFLNPKLTEEIVLVGEEEQVRLMRTLRARRVKDRERLLCQNGDGGQWIWEMAGATGPG